MGAFPGSQQTDRLVRESDGEFNSSDEYAESTGDAHHIDAPYGGNWRRMCCRNVYSPRELYTELENTEFYNSTTCKIKMFFNRSTFRQNQGGRVEINANEWRFLVGQPHNDS